MNKLTALYAVMKHMKEQKTFKGKVTGELKMGEALMPFEHECGCHEGSCKPPHKFMKHHKHGHGQMNGEGCCGHKLGKAMMMLKLLDHLNYEELPNGQKQLSLEMAFADLPEDMQEKMLKKRAHLASKLKQKQDSHDDACCNHEEECCSHDEACCEHSECHKAVKTWFVENGGCNLNVETLEMGSHSVKLIMDENAKPLEMHMACHAKAKTHSGEKKDLYIQMKGKML